MPESIQSRSLHYLEKKLKHTVLSLERCKTKPNSTQEMEGLKNKLEILLYLRNILIDS